VKGRGFSAAAKRESFVSGHELCAAKNEFGTRAQVRAGKTSFVSGHEFTRAERN
jgi:hypothetical protein